MKVIVFSVVLFCCVSDASARLMAYCSCPSCYNGHPNNIYRLADEAHARAAQSCPTCPTGQVQRTTRQQSWTRTTTSPTQAAAPTQRTSVLTDSSDRAGSGESSDSIGTPPEAIDLLWEVVSLRPDDVLVDLGCGDGRVLVAAAKRFGCRGLGIERKRSLVERALDKRTKAGLRDRVAIMYGKAEAQPALYSGATVVYMYQHGHDSRRFIDLVPDSARVITFQFPVPGYRHIVHRRGQWTFYEVIR